MNDPAPMTTPEPEAASLSRLQRLVPLVQRLVGKVSAVGRVSAVAALVLWGVLCGAAVWPLSARTVLAVVVLGVLLVPAAGTWLAVATMREVLELPARLRALPGRVLGATGETIAEAASVARPPEGEQRSGRLLGFFGVLWRLREVVGDTRGTLLRTVALARAARLASLPFVLVLVAAFALNFVVIAVAVAVVLAASL
ncbi:MAG: hypothetical protein AAGI91_05800 [Bacteroidota bacterium]